MGYGGKAYEQHKDVAHGKKSIQFAFEVLTEKI